jgi:hypothetical protein
MRLSLITICLVCMVGLTQAAVTFDFDTLNPYPGPPAGYDIASDISDYMTDLWGSTVTIPDPPGAVIRDDGWASNGTNYMTTFLAPDYTSNYYMEILFVDVPIVSMSFDWVVLDAPYLDPAEATFEYVAYDKDDVLVDSDFITANVNEEGTLIGDFGGALVTRLYFSNEGHHDIAIDNLAVAPVPAPSAILLGSLGAGIVGWLRRRRTL